MVLRTLDTKLPSQVPAVFYLASPESTESGCAMQMNGGETTKALSQMRTDSKAYIGLSKVES